MAEKPVQTFSTPQAAKQYADALKSSQGASIGPKTGVSLAPTQYVEEGMAEVGRRAKAANPQYAGLSDKYLGSRLVSKYPQYAAFAESYDPYAKKTTIAQGSEDVRSFFKIPKDEGGVFGAAADVAGFFKAAGSNIVPEVKNVGIYGKRLLTQRENIVADAAKAVQGIGQQFGSPIQMQPVGSEQGAVADTLDKLKSIGYGIAEAVAETPVSTVATLGTGGAGRAAISTALKEGVAGSKLAFTAAKDAAGAALPSLKKAADTGKALAGRAATIPGKAASESTKFAISQATGLNRSTIAEAIDNVKLPKYQAMGEETARRSVVDNVLASQKARAEELSQGGKLYEKARATKTDLTPQQVSEKLDAAVADKLKVDMGKVETAGTEFTRAEGAKIQGALDEVKADLAATQEVTGQTLHNIRQKLDKYIDFNDPSVKSSNGVLKGLRKSVDDLIREKIPEVKQLDATYGPERKFLDDLKRDLLKADGTPKDNVTSILANLTGKGKEGKLARIEKLMPGITQDVNALRALADIEAAKGIKVGTYTRGGIAALGGASALSGGAAAVPLMLTAFLSHPSVAVGLLQKYGGMKRWLAEKIFKGRALRAVDKESVREAFQKAAKAIDERQASQKVADAAEAAKPAPAPLFSTPVTPVSSVVADAKKAANSRFTSGDIFREGSNSARLAVAQGRISPSQAEKVIDDILKEELANASNPAMADSMMKRAQIAKEQLYNENGIGLSGPAVPRPAEGAVAAPASSTPQALAIFQMPEAGHTTQLEHFLDNMGGEKMPWDDVGARK